MRDINECRFTGFVGQPPIKFTKDGATIVKFHLACKNTFIDSSGNERERVTWVQGVCFNKVAESFAANVDGGNHIEIRGEQVTRTIYRDDFEYQKAEINTRWFKVNG